MLAAGEFLHLTSAIMSQTQDAEKAEAKVEESGGNGHTTRPSDENQETLTESGKLTNDGSSGGPDSDHEEVEEMDSGHQEDLRRQRVRSPPSHYRSTSLIHEI